MRGSASLFVIASSMLLGGCLARTAVDIVTAPVRVASKAVDLATTSQSESDEKRGRELRGREEQLGKLERQYTKLRSECADGDAKACSDARETYAQMQELSRTLPPPPEQAE